MKQVLLLTAILSGVAVGNDDAVASAAICSRMVGKVSQDVTWDCSIPEAVCGDNWFSKAAVEEGSRQRYYSEAVIPELDKLEIQYTMRSSEPRMIVFWLKDEQRANLENTTLHLNVTREILPEGVTKFTSFAMTAEHDLKITWDYDTAAPTQVPTPTTANPTTPTPTSEPTPVPTQPVTVKTSEPTPVPTTAPTDVPVTKPPKAPKETPAPTDAPVTKPPKAPKETPTPTTAPPDPKAKESPEDDSEGKETPAPVKGTQVPKPQTPTDEDVVITTEVGNDSMQKFAMFVLVVLIVAIGWMNRDQIMDRCGGSGGGGGGAAAANRHERDIEMEQAPSVPSHNANRVRIIEGTGEAQAPTPPPQLSPAEHTEASHFPEGLKKEKKTKGLGGAKRVATAPKKEPAPEQQHEITIGDDEWGDDGWGDESSLIKKD